MTFSKTLNAWYSANKRSLPWRKTKDPYCIWLSEIILQQTQIKQGLPYYEAFIKQYPTVFKLADAQEKDVLKLWQGLGYYSRARNLHATAKMVANEYRGVFPVNYENLKTLKGVGDYTASAIASICYNEATAVVDGNVYRVLSRYFGVNTPINTSKGQKEFKLLAQKLIDKQFPDQYNQAIMEFGAIQCRPKSPNCLVCPLKNRCVAFGKNIISDLPVKLKKAKVSKKHFNFLVFVSSDKQTILEQRTEKGIWQNLYQFPLVETNKSVDYTSFLKELEEHKLLKEKAYELSLYNEKEIIHKLSHQHLHTKFWIVQVDKLPAKGISVNAVHEYAVPALIEKFINRFNF